MSVLAINGWAQKADSIRSILPESADLVGYGDCNNVEEVFKRIAATNPEPDVMVGWSLGGQLALRAVAAGVARPKKLVLLGAPYQMVADKHFKGGTPKMMVLASRAALATNAEFMLREFQAGMLAKGDSKEAAIKATAPAYLAPVEGMEWLFWFDELERFSCRHLDFSGFPPTHIIHGDNDAVIPFANAEHLHAQIAGSTLHKLEKCGHAPHWHDENFVKTIITDA